MTAQAHDLGDNARALRAWFDGHTDAAPDSLRDRMRAALRDASIDASTAETLLGAALACLDDALARSPARAAAHDLLAADALLTLACEAATDEPGVTEFASIVTARLVQRALDA